MIRIKKGLDLPIQGQPEQRIDAGPAVKRVALLGQDYVGMKPTMQVAEGDRVKVGQVLFSDKKTEGVVFTSPGSGTVAAVNRGAKRSMLSVVIDVDGDDAVSFAPLGHNAARKEVTAQLLQSGLWPALRTRPYGRVPAPDTEPFAVFINAMDSNPLAGDPALFLAEHGDDFALGQDVVAKLTNGSVFVCKAPGAPLAQGKATTIRVEEFDGPHPAGLVGTHIHFLAPVGAARKVWYLDAQDVTAIGHFARTGTLLLERVISLAGPLVKRPRLLRTRLGASVADLVQDELNGESARLITGSILSGRTANGAVAYLGRYHRQVSVLREDRDRHLLGYLTPGTQKHSVMPVFLSSLSKRLMALTTSTNGSPRAMVPIGAYERVMPLDVLATQLLRYLLVGDVERSIELGCLELEEEDLALCTYACPGKYEYGPVLRNMLNTIEREG